MSTKAKNLLINNSQTELQKKAMKAVTFFSILIIGWSCSAQENPWLPQGENPWKAFPENQTEIAIVKDSTVENSDTVFVQSDNSESSKISDSVMVDMYESDTNIFYSNEVLIDKSKVAAFDDYKSAKDFAFGFAMGLFFNLPSLIIIDPIYISVNSKKEKETMKKIEKDSRYAPVDDEVLHKKVKSQVKSKKALSTMGGTIVGSLAQIGIFVVLLIN